MKTLKITLFLAIVACLSKLSDRGSAQVLSVVTDIGAFLPVLYEALHEES